MKHSIITRGNSALDFYDPLFEAFFGMPLEGRHHNSHSMMRTDVKENKDSYALEIEVPGLNKENIKLSVEDGYLTVSAEEKRSNEQKDKEGNYISQERYYGSYSRQYYVGDIKESDIQASLNNGILNISFPKEVAKQETKKFIEIK